MSYDDRSLQLAAYFFESDHDHVKTVEDLRHLAQSIQDTAETFIDALPIRTPTLLVTGRDTL